MDSSELMKRQEEILREFNKDSRILGDETVKFLKLVYPAYLVNQDNIEDDIDKTSLNQLQSITFFRIANCTTENAEKLFESVSTRFQKLFTALYSINIPIAYGLISQDGITNLVIGIYKSSHIKSVKSVMQGMLSGIELNLIKPTFSTKRNVKMSQGILSGIPSLYVNDEKQNFSLSSIMRSLNGQNYTLLFIAKPVKREKITESITNLINVRDNAFAVSKRNIARSNSYTETNTRTETSTDTNNSIAGQVGSGTGTAIGAAAGAVIGSFVLPGGGTIAGTALGGAIGGGLGTVIGNVVGQGKAHAEGYSESISAAITNGDTVSGDIQNGFALELMNYADRSIERLKAGLNNGIWQTAIVYSAENDDSRNIIRACLCGELSKLDAEKLPMLAFEPKAVEGTALRIPTFLGIGTQNPLCSYINSSELGLLCTVPTESVPDFELRLEKNFSLIASRAYDETIELGNIVDGKRILDNMPFSLSELDLNKHTFVCGITGSGKTTTVKKLLIEAKKPFLVIESAKKEYRNIEIDTDVYTLGKPEINAPQINPFYIMPGVNPQMHIDYLKDLFNASFSFYGPMPYILEKCLHSVYKNKGWDLTLGYHPLLANCNSFTDFFGIEYTKKKYGIESHKYLFPTMQELKDEIARYIDEELKYDGEVAGNVKTAIKVRLENLCIGAKGYTFNTNNVFNFEEALNKNVVFELEGLADDSDKAFCVGLLIIFINEYRQVQKELIGNKEAGLQHLLVIEEAHRLLKNIDAEKSTESIGNPKGKAVEHFTNMIAEMRSYGQGVIVAEQIPTKIAPDVIKNTSTKIVQRIVSADDQHVIANTIGVSDKDAVQLGFLESGYAYCHKEGMVLPAPVRILDTYVDETGKTKKLSIYVSDEELYNKYKGNGNRFEEINLSNIRSILIGDRQIKEKSIAFLNTLLCEKEEKCILACKQILEFVKGEIRKRDIPVVLSNDLSCLASRFFTEIVLTMMVRGVYRTNILPEENFISLLERILFAPSEDDIKSVKENLQSLYTEDIQKFAKTNIVALIKRKATKTTDIAGTIRSYFIEADNSTIAEIKNMLDGGALA